MSDYGVHWFRRDLRISGNPALLWNWRQNQGRVVGVFFFDSSFLSRSDFSHSRFCFFINTLEKLKEDFRALGGDLLVLDALPQKGFIEVLSSLERAQKRKPRVVTFNRDYEPFARSRDTAVTELLEQDLGVQVHTERDHLLVEPHELKKESDGSFYKVYTPFARKWFGMLSDDEIQKRIENQNQGLKLLNTQFKEDSSTPLFRLSWSDLLGKGLVADQLEKFKAENIKNVTIPIPEAGSRAAFLALEEFKTKVNAYKDQRDFPAVSGTSKLSIYLKNGSLSIGQVIASLGLNHEVFKPTSGKAAGRTQYLKELVWREFYYHILWHCPRIEGEAFLTQYRNLPWENRLEWFEAWKEGQTGYPIVDAGMRQLKYTGWMHNRVRMIVASFLTKDLLIDWRWGEKLFMERLLDGDLAPNNGGWQWAASTGCDPQPYFRIFNPTLQSLKFDPEGIYLKRWLPERAHLSGKSLHEPINPIIDHSVQKKKALALYRAYVAR